MIKAIFLDWMFTLADYYPPREEMHTAACSECGIEVTPASLKRALPVADQYFLAENLHSRVDGRSPQEQARIYLEYEDILLKESGVPILEDILPHIVSRIQNKVKSLTFVLYDDVLPTFRLLKQKEHSLRVKW